MQLHCVKITNKPKQQGMKSVLGEGVQISLREPSISATGKWTGTHCGRFRKVLTANRTTNPRLSGHKHSN